MQPFGVALLLISAVAAIGWLLGGRSGGWRGWIPAPGDPQPYGATPKGDGDAGQAVGMGTMDIPLDGAYEASGATQGAHRAAMPATGTFDPAVTPVLPPVSATYVPDWTNPDSKNTQVD